MVRNWTGALRMVTMVVGWAMPAGLEGTVRVSGSATALITGVVLLAAVLHAVWNALTHAITDKIVAIAMLSCGGLLCSLVGIGIAGVPGRSSWPYLLASALVQALYIIALTRSYSLGSFNQVYPIARGTSPLVVAVVAALFLTEPLGGWQLAGVGAISIGLFSLVGVGGWPRSAERAAVFAAFATGLLISTYTVIDGLGVRRSDDPLAYAAWLFLFQGALLLSYCLLRRGPDLVGDVRPHLKLGVLAGVFSAGAYWLVLWAQSIGSLAAIAALRESSVVIGAAIGAVVFREPFGRWRTVATVVVATGIIALNLG